jgi:hypothetical protein
MQKFILLTAVLFSFFKPARSQDVMIVNDKNAEARTASGFHGIRVSHAIDVIIKQGNEEGVVVSASEEKYRNKIRAEVRDGILRIWYDNEGIKINWNEKRNLRAYVSVKNLDVLSVSGACDVKIDGVLKGDKLKINLGGASSLKGELNYDMVKLDQGGASDSNLKGKVRDLSIDASGASDFKGFDLVTENCKADASGASDIKITVMKELRVHASGASDIDYKGTASISSFSTSGSSSVRKREK